MIRPFALLLTLCASFATARANIYVPKAKLAGESVYVRIGQDAGNVAAVFNFENWETSDAKMIYFPIYGALGLDPASVLAQSGPEIVVDDTPASTLPVPCEPPAHVLSDPPGTHAYWYCINIDDTFGDKPVAVDRPGIIVHLRYKQPLIKGRFYYLPVILGQVTGDASWSYQLLVRADHRLVRVTSPNTESYPLEDAVVIHLKDRQIVEVR